MEPGSLEQKFEQYEAIEEQFLTVLDESRNPRGSDQLYDLVADLGLPPGSVVLDAGCGKGRQLVELARRFDVRLIGVDLAPVHLDLAAQAIAAAAVADRIDLRLGRVEALPVDGESVDLVWCKDVLGLVEDLPTAYTEFFRVLRPGGKAIVYQSGIDGDLTEREAARFYEPLDGFVASSDPAVIEAAIAASGLVLDRWMSVGVEWGEEAAEVRGIAPRRVLHLARLLRSPRHYVERFGQWAYDVMVADCYWHLYRVMGKVDERVYLLTRPRPA